jgi:hypothetical protein
MNIDNLNLEQLRALNEQVCDRMRQLTTIANVQKIANLQVGMEGYYTHKGLKNYCKVHKILRTNIDVIDQQNGKIYRMPAHMFSLEA